MRLSPNASRITAVTFLISLGVVDVVSAQQAVTSTLITNVSVLDRSLTNQRETLRLTGRRGVRVYASLGIESRTSGH